MSETPTVLTVTDSGKLNVEAKSVLRLGRSSLIT